MTLSFESQVTIGRSMQASVRFLVHAASTEKFSARIKCKLSSVVARARYGNSFLSESGSNVM